MRMVESNASNMKLITFTILGLNNTQKSYFVIIAQSLARLQRRSSGRHRERATFRPTRVGFHPWIPRRTYSRRFYRRWKYCRFYRSRRQRATKTSRAACLLSIAFNRTSIGKFLLYIYCKHSLDIDVLFFSGRPTSDGHSYSGTLILKRKFYTPPRRSTLVLLCVLS